MPGAGKSTFTKIASQYLDAPIWYVGQPLLEECSRLGLAPSYANRMEMGSRLGLFDKSDPLKFIAYSHAMMRAVHPYPSTVIFDSVRCLAELEFLKSQEPSAVLVAVLLGRAERNRRLMNRDKVSLQFAQHRDQVEVGRLSTNNRQFSVGDLLALADHYVLSPADGDHESPFRSHFERLLKARGLNNDFTALWASSYDGTQSAHQE